MVDSSIAQAYIQMIRNAENFIYVENQYFLGSAYCWFVPFTSQHFIDNLLKKITKECYVTCY